MANEARGEFEIELEGVPYGMRPSYDAVEAYEAQTGKSNAELYLGAAQNTIHKAHVAIVVTECCKAWGNAVGDKSAPHFSARRVGELIMESPGGLLLVKSRLQHMLWLVETGGVTSSGEAKAMPEKTTDSHPESGSPASPPRPSDGRPVNSGKAPRRSSGRRS